MCGCDTVLTFPQQYSNVADVYIKFINDDRSCIDNIKLPATLKLCFELCHFIGHRQFFNFLMQQLFNTWSTIASIINDMNDNLKRDIYLLCPYNFLPIDYQTNLAFLNVWYPNHETITCVEGKYYFTQCTFDNKMCGAKHLRLVEPRCAKTTKDEFVIHGTFRIWGHVVDDDDNGCDNKQQYLIIEDNYIHGLRTSSVQYHNNGNVGEINNYDDSGKLVTAEAFYPSGVKYAQKYVDQHNSNTTNDICKQVCNYWYKSGNVKSTMILINGNKHGCVRKYFDIVNDHITSDSNTIDDDEICGQGKHVKREYHFDCGKEVGVFKEWYYVPENKTTQHKFEYHFLDEGKFIYYEWDVDDNLMYNFSSDDDDDEKSRPAIYTGKTFKLKSTSGNKYSFVD